MAVYSWDRSTSDLGKLPFPISQHKLASLVSSFTNVYNKTIEF